MATVKDIEGKLNTHEAVCAERMCGLVTASVFALGIQLLS
jgi:hypothetical protein